MLGVEQVILTIWNQALDFSSHSIWVCIICLNIWCCDACFPALKSQHIACGKWISLITERGTYDSEDILGCNECPMSEYLVRCHSSDDGAFIDVVPAAFSNFQNLQTSAHEHTDFHMRIRSGRIYESLTAYYDRSCPFRAARMDSATTADVSCNGCLNCTCTSWQ